MASICRLCATLRKIETFVNIHDTSLDICMKLEKCCQLLVPRTNDVLPQNVCNECVLILNDCWKFFQKVHESQESLSKIFYISDNQINTSNSNNNNQKIYHNQTLNNAISSTSPSPRIVHSETNTDTMNNVQNSEVETLLHNITIIGTNNNRLPNEIVQNRRDNDSENDMKIEIAEQITFEGLDESDFAIATGTITNADDNHNNDISSNCHDEHEIEELQLHNLNDEINVNERCQETETNKFVDQTIDQIENQIEDEEYQHEDEDNSDSLENTDNSTSTTLLSTSLSKSMLMESLNEENLESLGSWNDYIWKCAYCPDFVTENVYNLRFHSFTEHSDKLIKYVCTDCLKTFDRYYTFINHVKTRHRVQLQLCCDICSEFCDSSSILAEHRSTAHLEECNVEFNRFGKPKKLNDDLAYCPICAKAFKNKAALMIHNKSHQPSDQKYKFPCDFCDKIFATKANWKAHHKIHVGLKDFVCALCGKGFVQKANLDEHMLTHTEDKPFECEECHRNNLGNTSSDTLHCACTKDAVPLLFKKYFSITKKLCESEHQKSANGILATCQLCKNKKQIRGSLRVTSNFLQHLKAKHKLEYAEYEIEKQIRKKQKTSATSAISPISFTNTVDTKHYSMLESIKQNLKNTNYVCTTADVWSGGKRSFFGYTCHWIDESLTRKSVALACRRFTRSPSFDRIKDLIHYLNLQFDLSEEKIVCTITDNGSNLVKAFKKFGIKRQYEINDDDELGSVSDEEEVFSMVTLSPRLPKHVTCGSHTLNLLATTDFQNCLKQNAVSYKRHKRSLGRFKTSERLAKHISVHSDIRPHKCTICGSSFREKDTLRVHSRIHTGEMPYSCDFCGKLFRFRSVLKTHRHQHTGERPYSCLECNHHFTNWPNYNKHMKRRHGITASNGQANSNVNMNIEENDLTASSVTTSSPHLSSATTISNLVTIRNKRQIESRATETVQLSTKESMNNNINDRRVSSSSSSSKMLSLSSSNNRTGILNQTSGTVTITQISELSTV